MLTEPDNRSKHIIFASMEFDLDELIKRHPVDEEATAALHNDAWVEADALSILLSPSVPVGHAVEGKCARLRYP